jgi:hypothetical protein
VSLADCCCAFAAASSARPLSASRSSIAAAISSGVFLRRCASASTRPNETTVTAFVQRRDPHVPRHY